MTLQLTPEEQTELVEEIVLGLHERIQFYSAAGRPDNEGVLKLVEGVLKETLARLAATPPDQPD